MRRLDEIAYLSDAIMLKIEFVMMKFDTCRTPRSQIGSGPTWPISQVIECHEVRLDAVTDDAAIAIRAQ